MIVKVKAFANLREVFGGEISIKLKERAVLKNLLSPVFLLPEAVEAIIDSESGEIKPTILILKNRRNIRFLGGLLTKLEDGDEVSIFPPLGVVNLLIRLRKLIYHL
ncbi:MAG: MoaD/ThiS family protein [Candidatus Caldatribacteriota bacterium]|nr:MoaD/ThiS family protein [Candidatus Caldatribacteriota bacterium]